MMMIAILEIIIKQKHKNMIDEFGYLMKKQNAVVFCMKYAPTAVELTTQKHKEFVQNFVCIHTSP